MKLLSSRLLAPTLQLFVLLVLALLSNGAAAVPTKSKPPVCIVGAGPAGLTAAHQLESKGYHTVIFEKEAEIGGKCQSYYEK
jgi:heterodisulfide reductase subunit A-like polyferredoxin